MSAKAKGRRAGERTGKIFCLAFPSGPRGRLNLIASCSQHARDGAGMRLALPTMPLACGAAVLHDAPP
jgi:hypothetical protein